MGGWGGEKGQAGMKNALPRFRMCRKFTKDLTSQQYLQILENEELVG